MIDNNAHAATAAAEDDFDAAFEAALEAKATAYEAETAQAPGADDDAAAEAGQSDPAQAPADKAGANEAAPPAQAETVNDIWANATPEQRAAFEAERQRTTTLEHADRSNRGRLSTLQRQMNELTANGTKPIAAAPRGAAKIRAMLASDEVKTAVSDYGEANAPLVGVIEAMTEVLEATEAREQDAETERTKAYLDEQDKIVRAAHGDYDQVARSPAFMDFYRGAPEAIRDVIERNAAQVVDGREVAAVVRLFKAEIGASQTPPADATTGGQPSRTTQLRQRQLAGSTAIASRGQSVTAAVPDDFDAAFEQFAARKAKRA